MLGMQAQPHTHHIGHHVPTSYPPLAAPSATSISCGPVSDSSIKPERPRLSLNTTINNTQPRTFGKGSSLRLDTLSAISPTVRNTFSNAYERQSTGLSTSESIPEEVEPIPERPRTDSQSSEASSASSLSSTSTVSLESAICPYIQPSHLKSILANSHYPKPIRRMSIQRPMFPLRKRVSFKEPLDEEIKTTRYILAHSDLESAAADTSPDSPSKSTEDASTESALDNSCSDEQNDTTPKVPRLSISEVELEIPSAPVTLAPPQLGSPRRSPRLLPRQSHSLPSLSLCPRTQGHKRDSSSSDSDSDDSCAHTPVAGRSKRRRWQWTLGALPGYAAPDDEEAEPPMGSREGSLDLSISPASNPSP
jgi:hypothetical protein